jgi:hypothetical protein
MTTTVTSPPLRLAFSLAVTPVLRWAFAVRSAPDDQPWCNACTCGQPLWTGPAIGRCTGCGQHIGTPPHTVEATAGIVAVTLALNGPTGWAQAAYALRPRRCRCSPSSTWPPLCACRTASPPPQPLDSSVCSLLKTTGDGRAAGRRSLPCPGLRHAWATRITRRGARGTDRRRAGSAQLAGRLQQDSAGLQCYRRAGDHAAPHRPSATWRRLAARAVPDRRCRDRPDPIMTTVHRTRRRP